MTKKEDMKLEEAAKNAAKKEETKETAEELLNYEDMIAELREIARKLDDPATPVEEAVKLHTRGMELIEKCETFLEKAELTITEVMQSVQKE
ncbi:MAG: exodeoxyribonuclease VII small subunit [Methanocorpusculum sp.]|nr:exodeoxyribonuclease VII small subunit [Methanocorpusculum sp.]